jgi:hypothetical protein
MYTHLSWFLIFWRDVLAGVEDGDEPEVRLSISSGILIWKYSLSLSRSTSTLGTYKDPS